MKERPMPFSGPQVQAILDGRMSVTRRPIKPQPVDEDEQGPYIQIPVHLPDAPGLIFNSREHIACPYGVPGDELWVRETWGVFGRAHYGRHADPEFGGKSTLKLLYRATENEDRRESAVSEDAWNKYCKPESWGKWKPSIHMPRWASRIQLVVKSVRAERLKDITADECRLEGVDLPETPPYVRPFRELWDAMYAKKPELQWSANPWVWRIAFERIDAHKRKECGA